jgi:hypothetical protein
MSEALERLYKLEEDIIAAKEQFEKTGYSGNQLYPRSENGDCMCPVCIVARLEREMETYQEYIRSLIVDAYA